MEQEHKLQAEYAALQRAVRDEVNHLSKITAGGFGETERGEELGMADNLHD